MISVTTLLLALLATTPSATTVTTSQETAPPESVEDATLGNTRNVHRSGDTWFAGQFEAQDVALLKAQGIARVINARQASELTFDEKKLLEDAGIEYVHVPFSGPETLDDALFDSIRRLLSDDEAGPTLFHCGSANRVAGAWLPFRVIDQGVPLDQALTEARLIGLRTPGYGERAVDYIERKAAAGPLEKTVKRGINEGFKDPELNVQDFVERFEIESREVYASRHAIVAALGLKPGMQVADVGAGTGLFTFPMSAAVGAEGWVFAVDIAPRFLQHILEQATEQERDNLSAVLCGEKSIGLPQASVDLVFVCDTYHHFEYPQSTLASIQRALRPGGRLVVIDFDRVPGTSSDWIQNHLRAGKEVFCSEIEAAGFERIAERPVEGLSENYFLEFRKASR